MRELVVVWYGTPTVEFGLHLMSLLVLDHRDDERTLKEEQESSGTVDRSGFQYSLLLH